MKVVRFALLAGLLAMVALSGCQKDDDDPITPTPANSLYTNNIKDAPVYLNLETGDSASVWDIAFVRGQNPSFRVNGGSSGSKGYWVAQINTAMTVMNNDTTGWNWMTDLADTNLAIGAKWADPSTYNPNDHSLGGYDTVQFVLKFDAYKWVRFHGFYYGSGVTRFHYNFSDSIGSGRVYWGTTHTDSITGALAGVPKYYRFGTGVVTEATWQLALVTSWYWTGTPPNGIGYAKYPYGRLNKTTGVESSWLNTPFDQVSAVPAGTQWHTDSDTLYSGQIFFYNHLATPRPRLEPWNKTLLVRQSGHVWKVSFDSYYHQTTDVSGYVTYRKSMLP